MNRIAGITIAVMLITGLCSAGDSAAAPKLSLSGRLAFENGQLINEKFRSELITSRQWVHNDLLNLRLSGTVGDKLTIIAEPEIKLWFNTYPQSVSTNSAPFRQYFDVSILEGKGVYSFFGNGDSTLRFSTGFFTFKYNPDAQNLGEYLFRSGAYPSYIVNDFDYPFARLAGMHLSSSLFGCLQQDVILNPELQTPPFHDWSLSYLVNANFKIVEAGAGIDLHHWFVINDSKTTPTRDDQNVYYSKEGVKSYFTFKGIKLMGRVAFDPKYLFGPDLAGKFGKSDLRLYAEAALLGVKNYPAYTAQVTGSDTTWVPDTNKNYYTDVTQRMPIMIGFNFPTCRLFDYFSLQLESYEWPFTNSYYQRSFHEESAVPQNFSGSYSKSFYKYDTWKWSLNAKKKITNGFSIIGQLARDHMHNKDFFPNREVEETLTPSNSFYWMARVEYTF